MHTMTRSGRSARLASHLAEPFVECTPPMRCCFGARTERWCASSPDGPLGGAPARQRRDRARSIFVPIQWSGSNASDARVGALAAPVSIDQWRAGVQNTPARVEPFIVNWYGFALTAARCRSGRQLVGCAEGGRFAAMSSPAAAVPHSWSSWGRSLYAPSSR